jgi:hypothetical protein
MSRSKIVCHSPADICFGCAHYQDPVSSPVCEYAGTYLVEMLRQGTGTTAMEYPEYRKAATRAADRLEQLEAEVARLREALEAFVNNPADVPGAKLYAAAKEALAAVRGEEEGK